jgi:endoglucanase
MCPLETGLGNKFNETYFTEFEKAVNYITMSGAYAVLDAHNYMRESFPRPLTADKLLMLLRLQ